MNWQILLAISVITYSVGILIQRVLLKEDKSDPVSYSIVFQLLIGAVIGIYAFFRGFSAPNLIPILPNLILMTILYGAGNVLIFTALKMIDASEFIIIFASRALWTIVSAMVFLGEGFSARQALGTFLILASIAIVSWKNQKFAFTKGLASASLAAVLFGLAFTNDAFIIRNFDVPSYLTIAFVIPALVVWLVNPGATLKMRPLFEGKTLWKMGVLAVLYAVSAITIFLAYQLGRNASQIAPLNQTSVIITGILSVIFLREKSNLLRKLLCAAISFAGVVLVM